MKKLLYALPILCSILPAQAATAVFRTNASWYGPGFHGNMTANGERYNQHGITAAHKTLPFGTRLKVCNEINDLCVDVRINDRGPYIAGRGLDLSRGAAEAIGMIDPGVVPVTFEFL
jgi:rare lipoprotein A